jgi:GNAT superfamily N-acetyltransferase
MLRKATHDDLPRLVELGEQMHGESPLFSRMAFSASRLNESLANVIGSTAGFAWVYEADGQVVAAMAAMAFPHWASTDIVACDLALFVEPAHRGGMGFVRLLNAYSQWARDMGAVPGMTWFGITAAADPEAAAALCERLGWRRVGVVMGV